MSLNNHRAFGEGRLAARNLRGSSMRTAVRNALATNGDSTGAR